MAGASDCRSRLLAGGLPDQPASLLICAAISYRARVLAACTAECFLLADDLAYRPSGDPELVFVVMMCAYASDVAQGRAPRSL